MGLIPDLSKHNAPDYVVAHERRQLKWFLGIVLGLLLLTLGMDLILGLYGKPTVQPKDNPLTQITPTAPLPSQSPFPTMALTPTSAIKSNIVNKCATYIMNGKTINACATCGNKVCETYETCTSSNSGPNSETNDCGGLYCPADCEQLSPSPKKEQTTMCPMDAKMCPDGKTYVGRSGPNCEFAACPTK